MVIHGNGISYKEQGQEIKGKGETRQDAEAEEDGEEYMSEG